MRNRLDIKNFQYCLILGIFAAAAVIGVFCCVQFYESEKVLFWISAVWTAFYVLTILAWLNRERTERFEAIMTPLVFGAVFLLFLALIAAGGWLFAGKILAGENVLENVLGMVIAEAGLIAFAVILYKYYLREPLRKLTQKNKK